MERHLNAGDFQKAKQIYKEGAHMGPYATLKLESPITVDYTPPSPAATDDDDQETNLIRVIGMTEDGEDAVFGNLANTKLSKGQSTLYVNYHVTEDMYKRKEIPCAVGGREEPNLDGCKYIIKDSMTKRAIS
jgi:hypothetical protein